MESYSVYIHIPYCKKKCMYCSFFSTTPSKDEIDTYIEAITSEIQLYKYFLSDRPIKSIYIGGGTPSLLEPAHLKQLIAVLNVSLNVKDNVEITMEVNPESVSQEKLKAMYDLGINRLSIGIQSFDDNILKLLGRLHDSALSFFAFEMARKSGFKNINVDIIYGIPSQDITKELDSIRAIMPDHVSFYYLTIEQGTPLSMNRSFFPLNDDSFQELYIKVHNSFIDAGYKHYEVSNFAKHGFQSIHNMNYWERGDYLGIGSGAHGFFKTGLPWVGMTAQARYENAYPPSAYIEKLSNKNKLSSPVSRIEVLDKDAELLEQIFLSLRTWNGVDTGLVKNQKLLKHLIDDGLVEIKQNKLSLTVRGMCIMDGIVTELF